MNEICVDKYSSGKKETMNSIHVIIIWSVHSSLDSVDNNSHLNMWFVYPFRYTPETLNRQKSGIRREMSKLKQTSVIITGSYNMAHINTNCLMTLLLGTTMNRTPTHVSLYNSQFLERYVSEIISGHVQIFLRAHPITNGFIPACPIKMQKTKEICQREAFAQTIAYCPYIVGKFE